jgi:hypothetical protein
MSLKYADTKVIAEITKEEINEVWSNWLGSSPTCCFKGCKEIRTKYSIFCFKHMYKTIKAELKSKAT